MSQEVDERVVEMRFDNAQFEKNVHETMQSLEKLNDSLQLDGAEKGFEKISDASAKVDFDEMQGALDNLSGKFSAVEVMGVAALSHITRQAIDTGEKLVKSLSLDQVTSGWNKYAQKTASVQTIMNATGKSITKVNSYLDKLMWFSDETSYGFTDMTSALSTLTAAGGDIEKMIPMIMGMANATAYAGKGAAEFQRVIYNLAQSYGTGAIQLIDWKSVEQAGVASQQLKQLLIDTGVSLGKIKEGDVTTGTFDNSLQKKWADKEVMETAFGKYAEFAEAVKKMVDANPGMLATQAIDALADQYDEVAVKAFKAAQEAKSFSEAVDATKDAVSSGWMETFDILFGNYEEAKGFWSDLAEEFWTMFAGGAAGRNNWLKSAFDSGLDQLLGTEGFGEAGDAYTNLLRKAMVNEGVLTEEAIEDAGSFQKALEESGVTAQQLYDVIGGAAEHYAKRAALSDKELDKLGLDRDKVDALANAYASMAEKIQNGSVNLDDLAGKMNQLSGREHFFNGILNVLDGINSVLTPIRDAFGDVFMTDGSPLYNFLKGFDELTGKLVLSEETGKKIQKVFTGVFRVLSIGMKGVKTIGKTAFTILEKLLDLLSPMGDGLLNIGSYIGNLLTWVDMSLGQAESLADVLGILVGAVAALVNPIVDVAKGVRSLVRGGSMEDAKKQFSAFGTVVDTLSSVLDKFKIGSVSAGDVIGTVFEVLGDILLTAFDGVGALIGSAFNGFKDAGKTVEDFRDSHVPMLENIRDTVLSLPEKAEEALKDFGGTLGGVLSNISSACRTALEAVQDFFNLQDGIDIYRLLALVDVGALALAIYGATKLLKKASDTLKNTFANPVADFLNAMTAAVKSWTAAHTTNNLATAAKGIATAVALLSGSMPDMDKSLQNIGTAALKLSAALLILAPAMMLLGQLSIGQAIAGVIAFIGLLAGLVGSSLFFSAIPKMADGLKVLTSALVDISKAFSVFAGGLAKLSIAAGILAVLGLFAQPICEAIITAEPKIEEALTMLITGICNVIVACAEPLAKALFVLAVALSEVIIYYLAWLTGVTDTGMQSGLDLIWGDISTWFDNHSLADLIKAWVASAADALKDWNPFDMFTVDMDGAAGKAGAALGGFVDKIDEIFGSGIKDSIRKAWGFETIPVEEYEQQLKDSTDAISGADRANKNLSESITNTANATNALNVAQKKNTDGLIALTTETGEVKYVTEDMARAMLNGEAAMTDAANASGTAAGVISGNVQNVDTSMTTIKAKTGEVNETVQSTTAKAVEQAQESTETNGGNLGEWLYNGFISKIEAWFPGATDKIQNAINSAVSGVQIPEMPGVETIVPNMVNSTKDVWKGLAGKTSLTDADYDDEAKKDPDTSGSGGTTTKTKSSSTKKTIAQQITEKYKTKLEANKTAREVLDSEYELWQTENQYSADEDTLLSKKMENAAAEIANQTDRVAIAQAKYDEMYKRLGADKTETKQAYANLLSEKTSLDKLKAEQYTNLFEDVLKRYDTDLDTLEKEYNLWTAQNGNTASKLDKIDRETEYQKAELEVKQKKEAKAKEQWEIALAEYKENDLRTKEAYNDYLDAQTESLELQNEIAKQALNRLDAQLDIISDAQTRMQNHMDLLTSIYGDGSLKDREDAYKQAVEQYGENSAEARKAKYQGITTSILGTVEALQNMNAELEKTRLIQQQLADGKDLNGDPLSEDDRNDLKDQLLSSRSSMVSFAGALADAMGLEDNAKNAVVRFANAIQKNWVPISDAFTEVWKKASEAMGEEMSGTLERVFGAAFREEGMDIGTEFVSAIASAMQGDYAGAIISAATGLIDLLFTDTGKKLTGGAGNMLLKLFSGIQNGDLAGKLANIGTAAANVGNSMSSLLPMLGQLGTTGAGAGMAVGGIGEALGGLGTAIMSALPELLIVVGILAAIAAVIGGIAWFVSNRKNQNRETHVAKDIGSEIDKGISDGVKEDAPLIDDAVDDVTQNAMDIAKGTLGTISKVMGDDYDYTPQIVPVVDLTNVLEGADEIDNAFASTRSLSLDGDISRNLANQIDAEVQLQNGLKNKGNDDTLNAINGLAGHMDGIVDSIRGMKMTIDGRKTIGYIDNRMGQIAAAKVR